MGTYITDAQLAARYKIFDTASISNVNSDFIYYAEVEVEAKLAPAYTVPFSAAHPTVMDLCIDTAYVRWLRMNRPKEAENLSKILNDRIDRIVAGKEMIVTGSGSMLPTAVDADQPVSTTEDYYPTHTMLGAENDHTRVSSERLSDLEDVRD